MTYLAKAFSIAILWSLFLTCKPVHSDLTKDYVQQHMEQMIQGYIDKDLDAIMESYSENAQMLEDGGPIVNGKANISSATQRLLENVNFIQGGSEVLEVHSDQNLAYDISYFNLTSRIDDTTTIEYRWKHLATWERQTDGNWKVSRLIFNDAASD